MKRRNLILRRVLAAEGVLTDDERRTLEQWSRRPQAAQRLAPRARVVLACAEGQANRAVASLAAVRRTNCRSTAPARRRAFRCALLRPEP